MKKTRILILGGGYAGLMTVVSLVKRIHEKRVEIVLVNRNDYHCITTRLHELTSNDLIGSNKGSDIKLPIRDLIDEDRVKFICDEVVSIHTDNKTVDLKNEVISYDYLVIAMGAEPVSFNIKEIKEHSFFIFDWEGSYKLNKHVEKMIAEYKIDGDESRLTFVVGGAGLNEIEFVYGLLERIPFLCKKHGVNHNKIKIVCCDAEDNILTGYGTSMINRVMEHFNKYSVDLRLGSYITSCNDKEVYFSNGKQLKTRTVVWAGGSSGNSSLRNLNFETYSGRVKVNEFLEVPGLREVYVLGDAAASFDSDGTCHFPNEQLAIQHGMYCGYHLYTKVYGVVAKPFKFVNKGIIMRLGKEKSVGIYRGKYASFIKRKLEQNYYYKLGGRKLVKQMKK